MSMMRAEFDALWAAGPDAVFALIERQDAQLAALTARVQQVEARLGGHRQNSHRPPSRDSPRQPPRGQRTRSGRAPGGQPGHPGQTLEMTATPDHVVVAHCGTVLAGVPASTVVRRQVVDLPPLRLAVTEHQAARPIQYGPRLLGLGVYLRPYLRISEVLVDLFGRGPSGGTLHRASLACAAALAEVEAAGKTALSTAAVAHADETSIVGAGKRRWVQVVSTARLTHSAWPAQRGHVATTAIGILPQFAGRLLHDAWAPYWHYGCRHGLCNAHHLRELTAIAEQAGQGWATQWHGLLGAMKRHADRGRAAGQPSSPPAEREAVVARYRALLADGPRRGRLKQNKARNLLDRLVAHEGEVLAFLHDRVVPFDNNQAERDLRMLKVQQKISGAFRDDTGADAFCCIRGSIATLRKQARQVLNALEQPFLGQPPMPTLLPE